MVIALVRDLIFATKIGSTAAAVGADVRVVRDVSGVTALLAAGAVVRTVIVDLAAVELDVGAAVRAIRAAAGSARIITYGSHVDAAHLSTARAAGADEVMARSEFSMRLPDLLRASGSAIES